MPELSDENIQKVKEQIQNLGQKAREAIGPEKAAAISASVPVVKRVARGVAIKSLRAVQTLCAAGAEKLEEGARVPALEAREEYDEPVAEPRPQPAAEEPRPVFTPAPEIQQRPEPEPAREFESPHREVPPQPQPRPIRSAPAERTAPEIIRPKSTTHARRTFTYFGVVLALLAAGALVFSGVTLIRILRPRFGPPEGPKSIYEPVRRVQNNGPVTVVKLDRNELANQRKQNNKPAAVDQPVVEVKLPEKVKINYAGVNVRDDHSTQGTQIIGKAAKGEVKLLEFWEGKDQYPWYRIEAKDVSGWVYGRYVDVPPPPRPKTDPRQPALNDGERMGRVNRTGVNIRSDHSTKNTRVLTRMSNKDVVILETWQPEGQSVPWYRIRLDNGGEGWVYGKYVELK